jgi:hypothetical protein
MECNNIDKIKPLDKLLDDQINEFESGTDRACDKDLDKMIWELGDYENDAPKTEAREFDDEAPSEETLVEKKSRGRGKTTAYTEGRLAREEIRQGDEVVTAHSMTPDSGK